MGNTFKSILLWVALCVGLMAAFNALTSKQENKQQIEYSQFIQQVNNGEVANVNIEGSVVSGYLIKGERTDKTSFFTNAPLDDNLVKTLLDNKVRVNVIPEEKPSMLASLFYSLLPVLLLIGAWFYFMRMQSGGGGKGAHSLSVKAVPVFWTKMPTKLPLPMLPVAMRQKRKCRKSLIT